MIEHKGDKLLKEIANKVWSSTGCKVSSEAISIIVHEYEKLKKKQELNPRQSVRRLTDKEVREINRAVNDDYEVLFDNREIHVARRIMDACGIPKDGEK